MKNQKQNSALIDTPLRLPPASDYLGQWLLALADHYPIPEMTSMATIGYRVGLEDLTPRELDIAFSETFKRHPKDFRPTAGQVRGYLQDRRFESHAVEIRALQEATITPQEAKEFFTEIRKRVNFAPTDIEVAKAAIKKSREEISKLHSDKRRQFTIEISDEELQRRQEELKTKALDWWESQRGKRA
jgi:hypothetical protein